VIKGGGWGQRGKEKKRGKKRQNGTASSREGRTGFERKCIAKTPMMEKKKKKNEILSQAEKE